MRWSCGFLLTILAVTLLPSTANVTPPILNRAPAKDVRPQVQAHSNPSQPNQDKAQLKITVLNTPDTNQSNASSYYRYQEIETRIQQQLADIDASSTRVARLLIGVGLLEILAACFQYCATRQAAQAASDSAESARLALRAERPYLLIAEGKIDAFRPVEASLAKAQSPLTVRLTIENFGKGPALVDKIVGTWDTMTTLPNIGDFSKCRERAIKLEVIGANCESILEMSAFLSRDDYRAVIEETSTSVAYGRIDYHDLIGNPYYTEFCWLVDTIDITFTVPAKTPPPIPYLKRGPATHNRQT